MKDGSLILLIKCLKTRPLLACYSLPSRARHPLSSSGSPPTLSTSPRLPTPTEMSPFPPPAPRPESSLDSSPLESSSYMWSSALSEMSSRELPSGTPESQERNNACWSPGPTFSLLIRIFRNSPINSSSKSSKETNSPNWRRNERRFSHNFDLEAQRKIELSRTAHDAPLSIYTPEPTILTTLLHARWWSNCAWRPVVVVCTAGGGHPDLREGLALNERQNKSLSMVLPRSTWLLQVA